MSTALCIPLTRRTKNHVNSMYFAVIAAGADAASGFLAARHIANTQKNIVLVFKDVQGDFLKRADGDAFFTCRNGPEIAAAVRRAADTGERQNVFVRNRRHLPRHPGRRTRGEISNDPFDEGQTLTRCSSAPRVRKRLLTNFWLI